MRYSIRYNGRLGSSANNDHGEWNDGQSRAIGDAAGEVPMSAAQAYAASGCFEIDEAPEPQGDPAPKRTKSAHREDPLD